MSPVATKHKLYKYQGTWYAMCSACPGVGSQDLLQRICAWLEGHVYEQHPDLLTLASARGTLGGHVRV